MVPGNSHGAALGLSASPSHQALGVPGSRPPRAEPTCSFRPTPSPRLTFCMAAHRMPFPWWQSTSTGPGTGRRALHPAGAACSLRATRGLG